MALEKNPKALEKEKIYDDMIKLVPFLDETLQWLNPEELKELSLICEKKQNMWANVLLWFEKIRESKIEALKEYMNTRLETLSSNT